MIDLDQARHDLFVEVAGELDLRYCLGCGSCVAACPAANATPPLQIRSLVRMVVLGLEDELLDDDSVWSCVTCSKCEELCPMGVKPFEVGLAIRRWQCHNDETRIPPGTVELYKRGTTQPVAASRALRATVGLDDPPPVITEDEPLLKRFREMLMEVKIINDNDYMYL